MMKLVLEWLQDQGGVDVIETANESKASILYDVIDNSDFYLGTAQIPHRSSMNVTFTLVEADSLDEFLAQALDNNLYALKGHRNVGGVRASIYNAMPREGCQTLADFMLEFEKSRA